MKRYPFSLIILICFLGLSTNAQQNQTLSINSATNLCCNISYNVGEVYVIYNFGNNQYSSKPSQSEDLPQNNVSLDESLIFYPNPASDFITFVEPKNRKISEIMIFSMEGRLLLSKQLTNGRVDVSFLPKGTYIIKAKDSQNDNFKLIKL